MKKILLTIIFFLISIEILRSQNRFEQGYSATSLGFQKDRKEGIFKSYDFVWKQTGNLFVVKKIIHEKAGLHTLRSWLINEKGEKITKKIYTDIGDFSEGLAEVTVGPKDFCRSCFATGKYNFVVQLNNNCGFINEKGDEIIPPKYSNVIKGFSSGFCLVAFSTSNYFYINKKGEQQFNKVFKGGEPFRGKIAGVVYRNGQKNFINTNGENIIPKYYNYIQPYSEDYEDMIRAYQPKGDKVGFWTSNCEELIPPQFDDFNYGYLRKKILVKKDKKYGFLDFFSGQTVIPINYEAVKKDKNLDYTLLKKGNDWFRSDTSFNLIRLVKAEEVESLGKGIFKFSINNKWGIVDSTGKTKCNPIYSEISNSFVNDYLPFKSGSKFGYLNSNGELIINPEYDKVGAFQDGIVNCEKGIYQYTLNTKGVITEKNIIPNLLKKAFFGVIITLIIGMTFFLFRVK
ncbi:MAG TPA: WG repeat-containing protein [Leadbetterella sp.]|nr:WG repeat-containing protein [Leadbetterella sp.]